MRDEFLLAMMTTTEQTNAVLSYLAGGKTPEEAAAHFGLMLVEIDAMIRANMRDRARRAQ